MSDPKAKTELEILHDISEKLDVGMLLSPQIKEILEIKEYLQISSLPSLEKFLSGIFENHKELRAYLLLDGSRSTTEISKIIGVTQPTISNWCRKWANELAIVESTGTQGQYSKKYTLIDLVYKVNDSWLFLKKDENE